MIDKPNSSSSVTASIATCGTSNANNNNGSIKDAKKVDKLKLKPKDDGAGSDSGKESKKPVKTTTVKDMLRAKRDSMRNMIDSGGVKSIDHSEDSENESSSSDDSSDSSADERTAGADVNGGHAVKLPDNLSTELLAYINKMTDAAKTATATKHNFFDANNMDLLHK